MSQKRWSPGPDNPGTAHTRCVHGRSVDFTCDLCVAEIADSESWPRHLLQSEHIRGEPRTWWVARQDKPGADSVTVSKPTRRRAKAEHDLARIKAGT